MTKKRQQLTLWQKINNALPTPGELNAWADILEIKREMSLEKLQALFAHT